MERTGGDLDRDIVERRELAEALGHADRFDPERCLPVRRCTHASASTNSLELATAPNTPPCILIILIACSWLPLSVAPQQSSSNRHSKPRSFASRMVVWTHT